MGIVRIIGVGDDGAESLGRKALAWIEQADLLFGGQRLLDFFPVAIGSKAQVRLPIKGNIEETIRQIRSAEAANVVVLASGDPNFYGIARRVVKALGKERVHIVPNVSAVQLAFARIKESWEDARLYSVHGREIRDLVNIVQANPKIAILTDSVNSPSVIAEKLLAAGLSDRRAYVCENLGSPQERIVETTMSALPSHEFSPLNVLVLIDSPSTPVLSPPSLLGLPDEEFFQRKPLHGLITKAEVRVISLGKLGIREDSIVWDVGSGSGSVSIEAARLAARGHVYAIERYPDDVEIIRKNVAKFTARNVSVVHDIAPAALAGLPDPDAVFVGGSGGQLREIVAVVATRMSAGGRIVINLTTLENLASALAALRDNGFVIEVTQVAVSRGKTIGGAAPGSGATLTRLEPLDPVFILTGCLPAAI